MWRHRIYIRIIGFVLGVYFRLYHRLVLEGVEHIPTHGPLLITINHLSLLEPFALGVALVERGATPGIQVWTVAKRELFRKAPVAWFLNSIGMFPIDRERSDLAAMRAIINTLKQDHMLAIAPEGTRSPTGQLQPFQPVIAKIAISRRIPILPVGAFGAEKALPIGFKFPRPRPITVRFGPVYDLAEFYNCQLDEATADRASWVMRAHVAELLPERMRQVPPPSQRVGARKS
jgi:1-acyl-sn-glycerol-3-phosphate acyltransferase